MNLHTSNAGTTPASREAAYTTPRPDVFAFVPPRARRVLDVGCSNGALGRSLKTAQPGRSVWGIEFDTRFATAASLHLDRVLTADLNQFDWGAALGDSSFDCIIFADVLEHLVQPERCLAQALRHLNAGGCVVISLPNIRHLSALRAIFFGGVFPRRDRGIFDRTHLRWFTIKDAYRLLGECGLHVSDVSFALRWGDTGGGRMNRILNRVPAAMRKWAPVRELLTYQMCLRAEVPA